jgi:hypothetical protein
MTVMSRVRCLSILLLIVLSHTLVAVHAATHMQFDRGECQLCAAYSDPSDAVSGARLSPPPWITKHGHGAERSVAVQTVAAVLCFRQRAPPLAI